MGSLLLLLHLTQGKIFGLILKLSFNRKLIELFMVIRKNKRDLLLIKF